MFVNNTAPTKKASFNQFSNKVNETAQHSNTNEQSPKPAQEEQTKPKDQPDQKEQLEKKEPTAK